MRMRPRTRYARNDDVHIAYQVFGDGPLDLVWVWGGWWHLEFGWTSPRFARFFERLASFARVIIFDKRGTGMSDGVSREALPTVEVRMDDLRAVLDAVGSERAAICAESEGVAMAMLFGATHPDRVTSLVLVNGGAKLLSDGERGEGVLPAAFAEFTERTAAQWGEPDRQWLEFMNPDEPLDDAEVEWWATLNRMAASPGDQLTFLEMMAAVDVRSVVPAVTVPTLVLHRRDNRLRWVQSARSLAAELPAAQLVELPGASHMAAYGDTAGLLDEVQRFLTGTQPDAPADTVLATVMFTDIVSSTDRARDLGDRRWRDLLDRHDLIVREQIDRHRGREVKTTGDGFLAAFDGPARAVRCAAAICDAVRPLGIDVRAGLHAGECEVRGDDLGGIAVHVGARIGALAGPGEVLVSSTVRDLVAGSGLTFDDRGPHDLKGFDEPWRVFALA